MEQAEKLALLARLERLAGNDRHLLELIAAVRSDLKRDESRKASVDRAIMRASDRFPDDGVPLPELLGPDPGALGLGPEFFEGFPTP
jgi:hypothetical protein